MLEQAKQGYQAYITLYESNSDLQQDESHTKLKGIAENAYALIIDEENAEQEYYDEE